MVGHSAGGLSVTDATHRFPKKVRLAVYLGATMLRNGFVTEQDVKDVSCFSILSLIMIVNEKREDHIENLKFMNFQIYYY